MVRITAKGPRSPRNSLKTPRKPLSAKDKDQASMTSDYFTSSAPPDYFTRPSNPRTEQTSLKTSSTKPRTRSRTNNDEPLRSQKRMKTPKLKDRFKPDLTTSSPYDFITTCQKLPMYKDKNIPSHEILTMAARTNIEYSQS